jgi:phage/conjugal plasmid C-4 type zinc finger TraR family protein
MTLQLRGAILASIHSFPSTWGPAVADDVDMTQHLEEAAITGRIAAIRVRTEATQLAPADCDDCEGEIPMARRKAVPWTRRCVRCQTLAEREFGGRA